MASHSGGYAVRIGAALNGLTYVAGLISFLSVVRYVGILFSLAFLCLFASAFYFDYRKRYAVPRSILNAVLIVFIILNSFRITIDDFVTPVVETLLILITIKFIEEKKTRDYMQIYAIATFLLAGSALLTFDLQFLINLLILSFLLPLCVVLLTFYSQDDSMTLTNKNLSMIVSKALLIPLVSIPMTALMFIILPRTGYPLLSFLSRGGASTGFTDTVKLGDISNIQGNATVILRIEMEKIDDAMLYWRGIVLDYFDGTSWRSLNQEQRHDGRFGLAGRRVTQTIYLEPYENRYLFALDKPLFVNFRDAAILNDLTTAARKNIERRIKYTAVSMLSEVIAQDNVDKKRYLELPNRDFDKVETLVQSLAPGKNKEIRAVAILHYLRQGQFAYSLKNLPITDKPLEDFLFTYKYGNCEYFASSMAVMLRLAGIPARLVGGYRGGYYNGFGGYYLITQNNAHVWVEAYFDGKGWLRMDPTPGSIGPLNAIGREGFLFRIRVFLDSLNYYWNAMVIGYDLNKQIKLLISFKNVFQMPKIDLSALKNYAVGALIVFLTLIATGAVLYVVMRRKLRETQLMNNFMKKMRNYGYGRARSDGLHEFLKKVDDPKIREKAHEFVDEFEGLFYRDRKMTKDNVARLRQLLDDL